MCDTDAFDPEHPEIRLWVFPYWKSFKIPGIGIPQAIPKIVVDLLNSGILHDFRRPRDGVVALLACSLVLLLHKIILVLVRQIVVARIVVQGNGQRCGVIHMLQRQRVAHLRHNSNKTSSRFRE